MSGMRWLSLGSLIVLFRLRGNRVRCGRIAWRRGLCRILSVLLRFLLWLLSRLMGVLRLVRCLCRRVCAWLRLRMFLRCLLVLILRRGRRWMR